MALELVLPQEPELVPNPSKVIEFAVEFVPGLSNALVVLKMDKFPAILVFPPENVFIPVPLSANFP